MLVLMVLAVAASDPAGAVTREDLVCPVREDWSEDSEECPCQRDWKPESEQLRKILGAHLNWHKIEGWRDPTAPGRAILCNALLVRANLQGAYLWGADLQGAYLVDADLQGANLTVAKLQGANLGGANLQGADLWGADLQGADLRGVNVENARLAFANLDGAVYAPNSPPPDGYLAGIKGLATVTFPRGGQSGLVQLRELLQKVGLRDLERQATFAIEHGKALHARQSDSLVEQFGGWLQLIFFEWTTGWGLFPELSILLLLGGVGVASLIYGLAIVWPWRTTRAVGVYRIWLKGRIEGIIWPEDRSASIHDRFELAEEEIAERLRGFYALPYALYFSLLSAFRIGWRGLNVGGWLTGLQPREYSLRARGWVRVVSGFQSIASVYLLAMWALTYFGRPFQ